MAAHALGGTGYSLSLVAAVVIGLGWAAAFPSYRKVEAFSPIVLVSLFAGLGTASLILARSAHSPDPRAVDVFLASVIAGLVLGSIATRVPSLPLVDPFSMTALGAILGAVGSACAFATVMRGCAREIVVVNRDRKRAAGVATDLRYGAALSRAVEIRDGDYADLAGARLHVQALGIAALAFFQ